MQIARNPVVRKHMVCPITRFYSSPANNEPKPPGYPRRFFRACFAVGPKIRWALRKTQAFPDEICHLAGSMSAAGIYGFGAVTALNMAGVDTLALVAPFSVAGAAIGFGLKDIAQSYVAGTLMVLNRSVKRGQTVTIAGSYTG